MHIKESAKRQLSATTLPALANQCACACAYLLLPLVLAHSQQRVINRQGISRQKRCSYKMMKEKQSCRYSGGCSLSATIGAAAPAEREWQQLATILRRMPHAAWWTFKAQFAFKRVCAGFR